MVADVCNHKMASVGSKKSVPNTQIGKKKDAILEDRVNFIDEKMVRTSTPIDKVRRNNLPSP